MRFPNAAKGVKKLFTAELLTLIASVATIIGVILLLVTKAAAKAKSESGAAAAGIGTIVLMSAAAVLLLIAAVMSLVGIIQAARDEGAFKTALFAVCLSLIASLVAAIFSSNGTVQTICQIVQNIMSIAITIFVITGVGNLADKLNNRIVSQRGRNILKIILSIYVLALIATIISLVFGGSFASVTASVLALVAAILNMIGYVLYLSLLSMGKNMLAE